MQSFNIHYNLPDWYSHLFALGERCAASSNAYQCTVPGNSTVAPSGNGSDIAPGGGAHFKYLSGIDLGGPLSYGYLQQWNDTRPGTQPDDYTVNVWANGSAITTNGAAFVNYYGVTAGSYSTLIRAALGESFRDAIRLNNAPLAYDASKGVAFNGSGGAGFYKNFFYIDVANVTVQGIQFNDPNNEGLGFVNGGNAAGLTVLDCVLDGYDMVYFNCAGQAVIQCLLINRWTFQSGSGNWPVKWDLAATSGRMVGCTCIGVNATGPMSMATALGGAGQVVIRDSVFFGLPNPAYAQNAAGSITIDHCISDVSTFDYPVGGYGCADAGGNIFNASASNQFVNTSTDFRLKAGSACIGAGVVDTVSIPAGDDIAGRARSVPWDIGAAAYAPAQTGSARFSPAGRVQATAASTRGSAIAGTALLTGMGFTSPSRAIQIELAGDVPGYYGIFDDPHKGFVTARGGGSVYAVSLLQGHGGPTGSAHISGTAGIGGITSSGSFTGEFTTEFDTSSPVGGGPIAMVRRIGRATRSGVGTVRADANRIAATGQAVPLVGFYQPSNQTVWNNFIKTGAAGGVGLTPTILETFIDHYNNFAWEGSSNSVATYGPYETSQLAFSWLPTPANGAVPLCDMYTSLPGGGTPSQNWTDVANGVHDAAIITYLTAWKTAGWSSIYLRIDSEMNNLSDASYVWHVSNLTEMTAELAAWKHLADLAHNIPGLAVRTIWNPQAGSIYNMSGMYPSGSGVHGRYVDLIGLDSYAMWNSPTAPGSNTSVQVDNMCLLARNNNLPFCMCETGVDFGSTGSPGSNGAGWIGSLASALLAQRVLGTQIEFVCFYVTGGNYQIFDGTHADCVTAIRNFFITLGLNPA